MTLTLERPSVVDDPPMPFAEHLIELRRRLIASLSILALGAAAAYGGSKTVLSWLVRPVQPIFFNAPTEAFHTRLRIALYGGFLLTLPLLLHQLWLFVARALPQHWRRRLLYMVPLSYGLFLLGAGLCLYLAVPAALKFLLSFGSDEVRPLLTLGTYLTFVTHMTLAFGAVFQLPLLLYVLNRMGLLDRAALAGYRRLVYFGCFVLGALMTPEVFSQVLLACLTIVLFEVTLLTMVAREA